MPGRADVEDGSPEPLAALGGGRPPMAQETAGVSRQGQLDTEY